MRDFHFYTVLLPLQNMILNVIKNLQYYVIFLCICLHFCILTIWSWHHVPSILCDRPRIEVATHYLACSWLSTLVDVWFSQHYTAHCL